MAFRKETVKKQFAEALPPVLEPGERVEAGAFGVSGPNPLWAQGLLGLIGFLIFGMRYYYIAVTDRRVIFMKASFWTGRPAGPAWADPRGAVSITEQHTDAKLWNWAKFSSPTKPNLRMNVHAFWRAEIKEVVELLGRTAGQVPPAASADRPPAPPVPPMTPPAPPMPPAEPTV